MTDFTSEELSVEEVDISMHRDVRKENIPDLAAIKKWKLIPESGSIVSELRYEIG